jgi:hypothetical protein
MDWNLLRSVVSQLIEVICFANLCINYRTVATCHAWCVVTPGVCYA